MQRKRAEAQIAPERPPELHRTAWDTDPAARQCRQWGVQSQTYPVTGQGPWSARLKRLFAYGEIFDGPARLD